MFSLASSLTCRLTRSRAARSHRVKVMLQSKATMPTWETLLDYSDPSSPRVTHTRGILIAGSRAALHTLGIYEQYVELLPALHKDALLYCLANTWLPMDQTMAHFEACDRLQLTKTDYDEIGKAVADRMTKTFLGVASRAARSVGVDGQVRWALSQTDRFLPRIYQGGRCTIVSGGPKDAVMELGGIPFAGSHYYQGVALSETKALMGVLCRSLHAKIVPARSGSKESLAISLSWV
jgi:hypothetical protein